MEPAPADLLWSFFMSALTSYRKDSVLRPFPIAYQDDHGEKDFVKLLKIAKLCPSLEEVNRSTRNASAEVLNLLRVVLNPKNFTLKIIEKEKFITLHTSISGPGDAASIPTPDYIFEVTHSSSQEVKFQKKKGSAAVLYAYHGSKIENFYSILNNGLKNNLNKVSLYGEGIYLSSDLSIALNYSPMGKGWNYSVFGPFISCVAVCEMIDHPDVKCTLKHQNTTTDDGTVIEKEVPLYGNIRQDSKTCFSSSHGNMSRDPVPRVKRSKIKGSEGGEIPEKYFVVRNDDLVRVKYLLLYSPACKKSKTESSMAKFWRRHQFLFSMLFYVFILMIASLCNSKKFLEWIVTFR